MTRQFIRHHNSAGVYNGAYVLMPMHVELVLLLATDALHAQCMHANTVVEM